MQALSPGQQAPNVFNGQQAPNGFNGQQEQNGHSQNDSPYGIGKSLQKEMSYVIPFKHGPELHKFNGEIKDFKHWKE